MSNQRRIVLLCMSLALACLLYLLSGFYDTIGRFIFVVITFSGCIGILYFAHFEEPNKFFSYYPKHKKLSNYNKSLLFLYAKLIEIDGTASEKELSVAKKILKKDLEEFYLEEHFEFLKSSLGKEANFKHPLRDIMENFGSEYRAIFINNLIRIATVDRFLSNKEEAFIRDAAKNISMGNRALNTLFNLHNFVFENDTKRKSNNNSTLSTSLSRAYEILQVTPNSSMNDIKEAYRDLAKIFHPDKVVKIDKNQKEATKQFQLITEAYDVIKKKRG